MATIRQELDALALPSVSVPWLLATPAAFWCVFGLLLFLYSGQNGPQIGVDPGRYLMSGASTADGFITYKYFFSPKPPGPHLVTSALHVLLDGRVLIYATTVGLAISISAVTGWVVALLTYSYTGSVRASVFAGLVPVAVESYAGTLVTGFMGKHLLIGLFLVSLLLIRSERPLMAVGVATLAPAFWQFAAVLPFLTLGAALSSVPRRSQGRVLLQSLGVMSLVTGTVVAPYILAGATEQLLVQTILVPFLLGQQTGITEYIFWRSFITNWQLALPVLAVGAFGWVVMALNNRDGVADTRIALVLAAVWFSIAPAFFVQTGTLDIIPQIPLAAVGVGVAVGRLPPVTLDHVSNRLTSVTAPQVVMAALAFWIVLEVLGWGMYPPYHFGANEKALGYLAGDHITHCMDYQLFIERFYTDAIGGQTGRRCGGLESILQRI